MFDFSFFQNDVLINEYEGLSYESETFVTEDITYNHNDKKLTRITDEYNFIIDLENNELLLKIPDNNYEGSVKLLKSSIEEKDNNINIIYQVDESEPINKIIITRR